MLSEDVYSLDFWLLTWPHESFQEKKIFRYCQEWEKFCLNKQPLEPIETFYDLNDDNKYIYIYILAWLVSNEDEPEGI